MAYSCNKMKRGISYRSALIALSAGLIFTVLIYYFISSVPPGTTLPVFVEGPQTTWTNVKIHQTPADSAEVAYLLKVHHSLPRFSVSATCGILLGWGILWWARSTNGAVPNAHDPTHQKNSAEQADTGQPATRSELKSDGGDKPQPESEVRSR